MDDCVIFSPLQSDKYDPNKGGGNSSCENDLTLLCVEMSY